MLRKSAFIILFLIIALNLTAVNNYSKILPEIDDNGNLSVTLAYCEYMSDLGYRDAKLDKINLTFDGLTIGITSAENCYSLAGYYYSPYNYQSYGTRSFVHDENGNMLLLIKRYYDEPECHYDFIYRTSGSNLNEILAGNIFFPAELVTSPRNYIHNIIKDSEDIIYISYEHEYWGPAIDQLIYQSANDGKTWTPLVDFDNQDLTNMILKDVHPDNNDIMFFAKDDGFLYKSEDHGLTTTLVDSTSGMEWYEHLALNGNHDFIFCGSGLIYANCYSFEENCWKIMKSVDDGFSWNVLNNYNGYGLNCIDNDAQNPGVLYACDNYKIVKSIDYGETFTTILESNQTGGPIKGIYQIDGSDYFVFLTVYGLHAGNSYGDFYPLGYYVDNSDTEAPIANSTITASCYPNPFNPETTIEYTLPENGLTSIEVFNIKGQLVKTLKKDYMSAGSHTVVWHGKNSNNKQCASGLYFYVVKQGNNTMSKSMILMK